MPVQLGLLLEHLARPRSCLGFKGQDSPELTAKILGDELSSYIAKIANTYPELADELVKIPWVDVKAVSRISELATNSINRPKFEAMVSDGVSEKRKYCGSLEAIVWLLVIWK